MPKVAQPPRTFQDLLLTLQRYWAEQGCVILQPYDMEVGAGTFHTATFLRAVGPEPWSAAYVQPSRRPTDGRYGDNPFRLQHYYQYQVAIKPSPPDLIERQLLERMIVDRVQLQFAKETGMQVGDGELDRLHFVQNVPGFLINVAVHVFFRRTPCTDGEPARPMPFWGAVPAGSITRGDESRGDFSGRALTSRVVLSKPPRAAIMSVLENPPGRTAHMNRIDALPKIAARLRIHSLKMTTRAGSGHPTTCLSMAEIAACRATTVVNRVTYRLRLAEIRRLLAALEGANGQLYRQSRPEAAA